MQPFRVRDCALITRMAGVVPAVNLRELAERLRVCPAESLHHHFCETTLRPTFDDPEFRNDFAAWASRALMDRPLAEQLGIIDPYEHDSVEDLRATVLDVVEGRLSALSHIPWARAGDEFHFMRAVTVIFDTGREFTTVDELPRAVREMTRSSLYFHFIEAQRRQPVRMDDFSAWLAEGGEREQRVALSLAAVDFHFLTLAELQQVLVDRAGEALEVAA